jgi:hypothetical protein
MTVGQVARKLNRPLWQIRRAVDSLPFDVPRFGHYRQIPVAWLPLIVQEIERHDWAPVQTHEAVAR